MANKDEEDAPVIEFEDVSFSYNGGDVLEHVNVKIQPLDFACVIGPNGGGKSTFIKLILGLIAPRRGKIRVFGKKPGVKPENIGYMAQHVHHDIQFPVSVMDVVLMGRIHHRHFLGRYDQEDRKAAENSLREVGMEEFSRRPFSDLSGGQRQRTLIARCLVSDPDMLLLDEPTSNVDIGVEREFYNLLRGLNRKMTIVVVSHDLGFVSTYVKTILCVNREVHIHPVANMDEQEISRIYGMEMQLVRHDHNLEKAGAVK